MKLSINGNPEEVSGELTIRELLAERKVPDPDMVSVELNGTILNRSEFETARVGQNDTVEFLYFMGGGARS